MTIGPTLSFRIRAKNTAAREEHRPESRYRSPGAAPLAERSSQTGRECAVPAWPKTWPAIRKGIIAGVSGLSGLPRLQQRSRLSASDLRVKQLYPNPPHALSIMALRLARDCGRLAFGVALLTVLLTGGGSARAQEPVGPVEPFVLEDSGPPPEPIFKVNNFEVRYTAASPDLPPIQSLLPISVHLVRSPQGYKEPSQGEASEIVQIGGPQATASYQASALAAISRALLARLHDQGLIGVYVRPSRQDIDINKEKDLRPPGDESLRIDIWVGRIKDVRTLALGNRLGQEWRVDNPAHQAIRSYSPLQPLVGGDETTTDVLNREALEDYIFFLNRHPGRHVEAALAVSDDREGITLDYRVYEQKTWNVYGQVSDTGSQRTSPWQIRGGYINRQLTNRDDILSVQYMNGGLNDVHDVQLSYDAPWFAPKRPDWMETSGREPPWLAWADRSQIPWWGMGKLRWGLRGGWTGIRSDLVGLVPGGFDAVDDLNSSDWHAGGRLTYNFFQHRNLFVDAFVGGRFRGLDFENNSAGNRGKVTLIIPEVGLDLERMNAYSAIVGNVSVEHAAPLGDYNDYSFAFGGGLGRAQSSSRWWVLKFAGGINYYLEPLLFPNAWRDPSSAGSSRLSHEISLQAHGQYAFGSRLIPQSSQVIGGLYSVRGFPQGIAVGDNVYVGSFEYSFHLPRALPLQSTPIQLPWLGDFRVAPQQVYGYPDWDLIFRAYVDAGKTTRNQPQLGAGPEYDQTLVGAGVGVELIFRGNFKVRVDWARGIYQKTDIYNGGQIQTERNNDIDPDGEFYFLFDVVW